MAFTLGTGSARIPCGNTTITPYTSLSHHRPRLTLLPSTTTRTNLQLVSAKKFSPRSGRNRRGTTTIQDQDEFQRTAEIEDSSADVDDGYFLPDLPGLEKDFWEGPQWDGLGFFVEYLWAFGVVFSLVACGIAVATYNEGATDFKETPAYKESVQSTQFLEEPDSSDSDVFESNPTEVAPSLE
ncbi:hypothetical protein Lal_00045570 [Lupinus albus]|uniref:Uncharacterized protein n=1 Tax=Lupinus albus TaxID=3870 RepID=A0A6A5NNM9_LUPAL|nr:hypothetical protein Lalb_Chr14g0371231 [Lupinus albus]KAF1886338.1 hypothetical protein Lal_00045570 [Lupinus albus]